MADLTHKKHIFFDLDDTLWDFEKNSGIVLEELFHEYHLQQKLGVDFETFSQAYKKNNQAFWKLYYTKQIDKQFLRNHRFNETFKLFGYDNYDENLKITEHYLQRSPKGTHLKEGCVEVLQYLRHRHTLHIITNGFKEVQSVKMEGSGIQHFFDIILVSEEHQLTKPDEKIFRLAESLTGADSNDCVMIGDNMESDIQGALQAGWEAIYYSPQKHAGYNGRHIEHLHQLKSIF